MTQRQNPGDHAFRVVLDDATLAWLLELSDHCQAPPHVLIAAMIRDIREDDMLAEQDGEFVTLQ